MTSFIDDDGNELDYNGNDFAKTKQVISFYGFKIKADSSVNIKVNNSAYNRSILGYHGDMQLSPSIRKIFNVFKNGNKTDRGYLVIANVDDEEIEVFFITGNANWFKLWDFKCNEIVTTKWDVYYQVFGTGYSIENTFTNTEGIIFPIVDFSMGGEAWHNMLSLRLNAGDDEGTIIRGFVPFIYVHTLLKLLSNHAGTNLGGNLFNDPFFKTIIIGPESMSKWQAVDDAGNQKIVKPEDIAPKTKAVDFLKWVSVTFGCLVSFDNESNTINLDIIDKIDKANALDWSEYYISHETEVTKYFDKNLIQWKESSEQNIADYNDVNDVPYGAVLIESDKDDGSSNPTYTSPYTASYDLVGTTQIRWATPVCDYYTLQDDKPFEFTSVTETVSGIGGVPNFADFNGTGFPWNATTSLTGTIIRVTSGIYAGYHTRIAAGDGDTIFRTPSAFIGNSSGTFYTQRVTLNTGHKVLSCIPNVSASAIMQYGSIFTRDSGNSGFNSVSTIATAYFSKNQNLYSILLPYNQGLSFGEINESGRNDFSLGEKYLNTYFKILQNAPIKATMQLPESVVAKFNFETIYLKTERLTGYFLVETIENYKESTVPVKVQLVRRD